MMNSALGLAMEEEAASASASAQSSVGVKLVPWISWSEWLFVYHSLFSDSRLSLASALTRIATWRSRGCLPVTVEVTASIIEIQLRDPHFRKNWATSDSTGDEENDAALSEEMLAMLYCMAIMRLVNGVIEKTRKQKEVSIAVAADAIGMPRMLIDIRHESSHRELPGPQVVRDASAKALEWLISYYWEPQKKAIPLQGDSSTKKRKRIERKLQDFALELQVKETSQPSSPSSNGKRNKKQITKILKNLVGLYSSCSTEVVSALLTFLLKALNSSNLMELSTESEIISSTESLLEDWKVVVRKLAHKEPDILVSLLKTVLDIIEIQENMKFRTGTRQLESAYSDPASQCVDHLSSLFTWLIGNLKELEARNRKYSAGKKESSTVSKLELRQMLHKCLALSAPGNKLLMNSAFQIAQLIGGDDLKKKLDKLSSLVSSNWKINQTDSSLTNSMNPSQKDDSFSQAAKKLELIKRHRIKRKTEKCVKDGSFGDSKRWVVAKTWNPCPIGMLPNSIGSSGCVPVLDKMPNTPKPHESNLHSVTIKAPPAYNAPSLDDFPVKKMRGASVDSSSITGVDGQLMIGGVWRNVGEEDLIEIKSAIRLLA